MEDERKLSIMTERAQDMLSFPIRGPRVLDIPSTNEQAVTDIALLKQGSYFHLLLEATARDPLNILGFRLTATASSRASRRLASSKHLLQL